MVTWALRAERDLEACNLHLASLQAAGLLGMVEEEGVTTLHFPDRVPDLPVGGRWEPVPDTDWNAAWRASIAPVVVRRVAVHPPWLSPPPVDVPLVIEPAQAFGTGHHETTAGCVAALQDLELDGCRVLDVGTGTGVLAIAALRLGAHTAVAVDTDPVAVATARENAAANDVELCVREGSVDAAGTAPFDVVLANLDTATLSALAGGLAGALCHGGALIAGGVSIERMPEALAALSEAGLEAHGKPGTEWAVLSARHRSP